MSPSLTAEFEFLTTRLEQMVERVNELPSDAQRAPVGKSYAPVAAVEHMAVTEESYVNFAKKTDPNKLKGRKGKPNFLYNFILKAISKPATKTTPSGFPPTGDVSLEDAAQRWREARATFMEHLKKFDDNDACLKNPIMGYLSPRDIYVLMERHQDYHDARIPN